MKIGILTFHRAHNYGAVLQAYGLQQYLLNLGHSVYIIDYSPSYITDCYLRDGASLWLSRNPIKCLQRLHNYLVCRQLRHNRWDNFDKFINNRFFLYEYHQGMDFHEFDVMFIGSDQVWSSGHTGGNFDGIFWGVGFHCKTIVYGASCTSLELTGAEKHLLGEYLNRMTFISVREPIMKEILQPLTKKEISVVVDPSLLAGISCFDKIATPPHSKRPYILIYEIADHPEVYRMALSMAKGIDADIVELTNGMRDYHRVTMYEDASPEAFLGYIKHASYVLTSSFHGTLFSLLFHRPFSTILQHNNADIRMISLLKSINMEERMIEMGDIPEFKSLDKNLVDINIQKVVNKSKEYIKKSLSEV